LLDAVKYFANLMNLKKVNWDCWRLKAGKESEP
jgi:hypothetical protein